MSDFGGRLRQARERQGISLRQIATATKISISALEALERNEVSKLPGGIFSRAFVRSYALEVGLDPEQTVKEFLDRFQTEPAPASLAHSVEVPPEETTFESQRRMAGVLVRLLAISLPVVGLIMWLSMRGTGREGNPPQAPLPSGGASPAQPPRPADSVPIDSGSAAVTGSSGAPVDPAPSPPKAVALRLEVTLSAPSWIVLTVDGERVLARIMQAGEREQRPVRQTAVLEVGDAAAVAFTINGRPGRALGGTGEAKIIRITPENYETFLR
jgi:cytoskeletal protein RodZ